MNDKDKKFLAEWMGKGKPCKLGMNVLTSKGWYFWSMEEWNPDTDHEQFTEVWNKLSYEDQVLISGSYPFIAVGKILNELPRVMEDVLRVIKAETRKCTECGGSGNPCSSNVSVTCRKCDGTGIVSGRKNERQR